MYDSAGDGYDPCEKTEMTEFIWVRYLLSSNRPQQQQEQLHKDDVWNTWFGVPYFQTVPRLYTYPRFQNLLEQHSHPAIDIQYPSLISFFGDTGGGKSTIIRTIIKNAGPEALNYNVPVPGTRRDVAISTSGDVHLYADPMTMATDVPLLYAGKSPYLLNATVLTSFQTAKDFAGAVNRLPVALHHST